MATRNDGKLNQLEKVLPEGLLVDAGWLERHGYSTSLRSKYAAAGWLEQTAPRVYRRPRGTLRWQQVAISLQTLLNRRLIVGGRTALDVQGYAHYVSDQAPVIQLHGPDKPPTWLETLPLAEHFVYRNSTPLFGDDLTGCTFPSLPLSGMSPDGGVGLDEGGLRVVPWGQWDWPMVVSTPERAVLELLDELPVHESFHQADMVIEGLGELSPKRLQALLLKCRSVKVKRLFFFFADRHPHAWRKRLDSDAIDFGSGKRMLVAGGRLDPTYQITIPKDIEAQP